MHFELTGIWAELLVLGIITYLLSGTVFFTTASWGMVKSRREEAREDREDLAEALKRQEEHNGE